MNYVLFESAGKQKYNAGSKARKDALNIAIDCGYKHIALFHNGNPKPVVAMELIRGCFLAICRARKGDKLLIQYPYSPMLLNKALFWILRIGRKLKKYKISVLIHDLSGLREQAVEDQTRNEKLKAELLMMRGCNLIYHNRAMRDVCESIYPSVSHQILGLFDYLYSGEVCQRQYASNPTIMIAGNLSKEKCGYIYQLSVIEGVNFDLFGANYAGENTNNIHYRGTFSPEELIPHLNGQFGLVWDGDTVKTCGGNNGNYLKYNNPHKLSLYIAAGVPLIVWKQSALAKYVEENKLGICVDSLEDLSTLLQNLRQVEYNMMIKNVNGIRTSLQQGEYLRRILA